MKVNLELLQRSAESASLVGVKAAYDSYRHCTVTVTGAGIRIVAMTPEATLSAFVPAAEQTLLADTADVVEVSVRTDDLYEAVRSLTGGFVTVTYRSNALRIKWDRGTYKLPCGPATLQFEEPPRLPVGAYHNMPAADFHTMLQSVTYWDVTEDEKAYTEVISIERHIADKVTVVQCGPRMVNCLTLVVDADVQVTPFCMSVMTARLLKKLAAKSSTADVVQWRIEGRDIEVRFGDSLCICALGVSVPFPQWRSALPRGGYRWLTVSTSEIQDAVRRVAQFDNATAVISLIDEELGIRFSTDAGVNGDESIPVLSSTLTPTDIIKLPADALLRAVLQHKREGKLRMKVWGEGSPVMIDSEGYTEYMQILAQMRF